LIIMRKNAFSLAGPRLAGPRLTGPRLTGLALSIAIGVLLSACATPQAPSAPGQQLTWQEKHALYLKQYQALGDARRQNNRPCRRNGCH
jgi:hypothetical protein